MELQKFHGITHIFLFHLIEFTMLIYSYPKAEVEGFPFPVKLSIDCNRKELLNDYKTIQDLFNQVYQFSRLY